ncbi:MAG TPA: glycosyltransferase [Thermoanaerobaculia bacterium]|nr:glycosyltransferase [Thermoanaerobaculia bacterium]
MRIAQIVLPGAAAYERKCQRADFAALAPRHDVVVANSLGEVPHAAIVHVYGPSPLPREPFLGFELPYVASSAPPRRRFALRHPAQPRVITDLPEAVEEKYFAENAIGGQAPRLSGQPGTPVLHTIGSYARPRVLNVVEQTLARIHRFREDVEWRLFEEPPAPDDLAGVDAWVDPAIDETDLDGFVAEAVVAGKVVVAARIAANVQRLEKGRTGFLVPPGDPNELTHAILTALFKPEVANQKIEAARQTARKYRPQQRLRMLERIYDGLTR